MSYTPTALFLLSAVASTAVAEASCDAAVSTSDVLEQADEVERAWLEMRDEGIGVAATGLRDGLPCLATSLTPTAAARIHRALGLSLVVSGDLDGAGQAFAAARYSDPGLGLSEAMAPEGTPVQDLYLRPIPYVPGVAMPPAHRGVLLVDGTASIERPTARPLVLQHLDPEGAVIGTWLLRPGEPLPEEPWHDPTRRVRLGLDIGAGVAAAGALIALGGAAQAAAVHGDPTRRDLTISELETWRDRSHDRSTIAAALGATALVSFSVSRVLR